MIIDTIIGIPGKWDSPYETLSSAVGQHCDWEWNAQSCSFLNREHNEVVRVEMYAHNANLWEAYHYAGRQTISETELIELRNHTNTIYLIAKGGSLKRLDLIFQLSNIILDQGGLALKVETAGKAFNALNWQLLAQSENPLKYFDAFTRLEEDDIDLYTVGMQNLGFKDMSVVKSDRSSKVTLIESFVFYQILESPKIEEGDYFCAFKNAPVYQLYHEPSMFEKDDLLHNPWGMWRLRQ